MSERKKILFLGNRRFYYGVAKGFKYDMFLELFKEEISRQHDVLCWGWGYRYNWTRDRHLSEVVDFFGKPDIILTHALYDYTSVGILDIDAIKVHIVGDFWHGVSEGVFHRSINVFRQYDILLAVNNSALSLLRENFSEEKCHFWPWSVDTNFFRNYHRDRPVDVFIGASSQNNLYGPSRKLIKQMLSEMCGDGFNTVFEKRVFGEYVDILNSSKISIGNNQKFGFINKRVLEIMACGSLFLTDKCPEFDILGFEDGKHMVIYDDFDDLKDKIYYYLGNSYKRESIALRGYEFVTSKFSMKDAVQKMMEILYVDINA
jgi:glycosyltransferase involved in cell wall biosynthesis